MCVLPGYLSKRSECCTLWGQKQPSLRACTERIHHSGRKELVLTISLQETREHKEKDSQLFGYVLQSRVVSLRRFQVHAILGQQDIAQHYMCGRLCIFCSPEPKLYQFSDIMVCVLVELTNLWKPVFQLGRCDVGGGFINFQFRILTPTKIEIVSRVEINTKFIWQWREMHIFM